MRTWWERYASTKKMISAGQKFKTKKVNNNVPFFKFKEKKSFKVDEKGFTNLQKLNLLFN